MCCEVDSGSGRLQLLGELCSWYVDGISLCIISQFDYMYMDIFRYVGDLDSSGHDKG